jgi:hypothetical protein
MLATAELYDTRSGSWTATESMDSPREYHTTTLLLDGTVLVAGGYGGGVLAAAAELYHPDPGN